MQPTRQEMLDKIKATIPCWFGIPGHSVCNHTRCMLGDVLDWQVIHSPHSNITEERLIIIGKWKKLREPLDKQSDNCISYIYNLLSHE